MKQDVVNEKLLKRAIVLCWALLLLCFIVKIFGSDMFNPSTDNNNLIKFAEFVDGNLYLHIAISTVFNIMLTTLLMLTIDGKIKPSINQLIIICFFVFIINIAKVLFSNLLIIFDFVQLIILPIIVCKNKLNIFIVTVLYLIFTLISFFIKSVNTDIVSNSSLIALLMSIDVIIMITISYLYSYKRNGNLMGLWFIFLSNDIAQLEAYKAKHKDNAKIVAKCDERIAKLKAKQKAE